jgi:hypothetical protein
MNNVPEFKGNVKPIATNVLIDKAAEKLYPLVVSAPPLFG